MVKNVHGMVNLANLLPFYITEVFLLPPPSPSSFPSPQHLKCFNGRRKFCPSRDASGGGVGRGRRGWVAFVYASACDFLLLASSFPFPRSHSEVR